MTTAPEKSPAQAEAHLQPEPQIPAASSPAPTWHTSAAQQVQAPATELFSIPQMVERVASVAVEKAAQPWALFVRSLTGGAMVAFGVILSLVVSTGIETPGIASLVMGLAFGMSLVLILASGSSLSTADMSAGALAVLQRRMTLGAYFKLVAVSTLGNVIGAFVFILVCAGAGGPYLGPVAERAAAVGTAKAGQPFLTAILLAVLCTWFLQTAMFMFFKARTESARITFAFYGPFGFVAAGTQHVIANVGFLALPLLLATFHAAAPDAGITWGFGEHGLLLNLVITTIGNWIGGLAFVALPFHVIARLQELKR